MSVWRTLVLLTFFGVVIDATSGVIGARADLTGVAGCVAGNRPYDIPDPAPRNADPSTHLTGTGLSITASEVQVTFKVGATVPTGRFAKAGEDTREAFGIVFVSGSGHYITEVYGVPDLGEVFRVKVPGAHERRLRAAVVETNVDATAVVMTMPRAELPDLSRGLRWGAQMYSSWSASGSRTVANFGCPASFNTTLPGREIPTEQLATFPNDVSRPSVRASDWLLAQTVTVDAELEVYEAERGHTRFCQVVIRSDDELPRSDDPRAACGPNPLARTTSHGFSTVQDPIQVENGQFAALKFVSGRTVRGAVQVELRRGGHTVGLGKVVGRSFLAAFVGRKPTSIAARNANGQIIARCHLDWFSDYVPVAIPCSR